MFTHICMYTHTCAPDWLRNHSVNQTSFKPEVDPSLWPSAITPRLDLEDLELSSQEKCWLCSRSCTLSSPNNTCLSWRLRPEEEIQGRDEKTLTYKGRATHAYRPTTASLRTVPHPR